MQERDQLSGARKLIPDEAVMRQFGQFLYADTGMPEQFDDSPRPECVLFFLGQVAASAGAGAFGPDPRAGLFHDGPHQRLAARGELLTRRGGRRRRQARGRIGSFLLRGGDQLRQCGQAFAGPLVSA